MAGITVVYWLSNYFIVYTYIHSLIFSLEGRAWKEPEPSHVTGMALAHCSLGNLLGVVCHCFPPPLDVPNLAASASVRNDARYRSSERWNYGRERYPVVILTKFLLPPKFSDLLHAANLRHGIDGFISPPKEGMLRTFSPQKSEGFGRV